MSPGRVYRIVWLALAAVFAVAAWFGVAGWLSGPRAGFDIEFRGREAFVTRVTSAGPAWESGVRPGFRLVSINDAAPSQDLWSRIGEHQRSFVFADPSGAQIELSSPKPTGRTTVALLEVTAVVFALASLLVVSRGYLTIEAAAFSWLGLVAGTAIAVAPGALSVHPVALRLEAIALHWLPVTFVLFFYVFGRGTTTPPLRWRSRWLLILPSIAILLDILATLESTVAPEIRPIAVILDFSFLAIGIAAGLALLIRRVAVSKSPVFREQTRVIIVGTALAVAPVILFSVIPEAAGVAPILPPQLAVLTTILIPLSFGYAILRHELMGIRRLVHRGVSYALITAAILALFVGALVALRSVGATRFSESTLNLSFVIALLAGVPLVPQVRSGVSLLVDRLLYRDFVDHQGVIREVSINAVRTTDLAGLDQGILDRVANALGLTYGAYLEFGPGETATVVAKAGTVPDSITGSAKTIRTEGRGDPARPVPVESGMEGGPALCATVPGRDQQSGYLFLGPKDSGEPFNPEDIQLAQTVASLLSTVIARIRLLDELRAKSIELGKLNV
ncbi:MAG: hypothetical protein HY678_05330, partial [Chloroflexi bacterium]|nr:hypothetical protein [Chloroflexota bacterium]